MDVVVTLVVAVVLGMATVLLAGSHNRPFDAVSKQSKVRWWSQIP